MNTKIEYFNKVAKNYNLKSNFFLWGILRRLERSQAIFFLREKLFSGPTLEVGCGTGYYTKVLRDFVVGDYIALDYSDQMIFHNKVPNVTKINIDFMDYQSKRKFKSLFVFGVLEFFEDIPSCVDRMIETVIIEGKIVIFYPRKNIYSSIYKKIHQSNRVEINLDFGNLECYIKSKISCKIESRIIFPFSKILIVEKLSSIN